MSSESIFKYGLWAGLGLAALVEYPSLELAYHTLGRDLDQFVFATKLMAFIQEIKVQNLTIPKLFAKTCEKYPNKPMVISADTGETWTFQQVDDYSNRVAQLLIQRGYAKGDVVSIFMGNVPKYVPVMLGVIKIGAIAALINSNLSDEALLHCIQTVKSKAIVFEDQLADQVKSINPDPSLDLFIIRSYGSFPTPSIGCDLEHALESIPPSSVPAEIQDRLHHSDDMAFIFTSGTTGLPKATHGDHVKFFQPVKSIEMGLKLSAPDILYSVLPLYHSSAQWMALGPALTIGCTYVMRSKFSASNFWKDCIRYEATCAQYIGEICRFLLGTPDKVEDTKHKLRAMYGVGLSPHIWPRFVDRFMIPNIVEIYGATDGNLGAINTKSKVGAVGSLPQLVQWLPIGLIKIDEETGKPKRDAKTGLCIPCQPGEPGEFVSKIKAEDQAKFQIYVDKQGDTEKKIIRDVWRHGDACFRSGDLLVTDEHGWLYFKDRTGDTFRWRGENVSTTEVEAVLSSITGLQHIIVYGVDVPGAEGKAGMATVYDPDNALDLTQLVSKMQKKLPKYAQPLFIRITKGLTMTGTYKLVKRHLQQEGFNVDIISDPVYFKGPNDSAYQLLAKGTLSSFLTGLQTSRL